MASDLRRETIFALQSMGIQVEYSHHEVAPSQHEIDLRYDEGLSVADEKTVSYRLVVKEIRRKNGVYADLHAQTNIVGRDRGSVMRVPQSLFKGQETGC